MAQKQRGKRVAKSKALPEAGLPLAARLRSLAPSASEMPHPPPVSRPRKRKQKAKTLSPAATTTGAPISIVPTVYPQEPSAGSITVQNHITINVHSADFHALENTMGQLLAEMRKSNAIGGEVRDKLVAEINAGTTILKSPKPDRGLIDLLLLRPLKYIAEKAAGATIGGLAGAALRVLLRMMGLG